MFRLPWSGPGSDGGHGYSRTRHNGRDGRVANRLSATEELEGKVSSLRKQLEDKTVEAETLQKSLEDKEKELAERSGQQRRLRMLEDKEANLQSWINERLDEKNTELVQAEARVQRLNHMVAEQKGVIDGLRKKIQTNVSHVSYFEILQSYRYSIQQPNIQQPAIDLSR